MVIGCKSRETMVKLKGSIMSKFQCTDKGPICIFLNLTITRDRTNRTITLSLPNKIKNILQDNQLSKDDLKYISTPTKIPASPHQCLTKDMSPKPGEEHIMKNIPYKSILGQALYIAITIRPDIATAVSNCGKFAQNPGQALLVCWIL
jgi:hypothetical protein